jgi:hypothetical protein
MIYYEKIFYFYVNVVLGGIGALLATGCILLSMGIGYSVIDYIRKKVGY